jgi:hypothetical protein
MAFANGLCTLAAGHRGGRYIFFGWGLKRVEGELWNGPAALTRAIL